MNKKLRLILNRDLTPSEAELSVALAHLIGYCSPELPVRFIVSADEPLSEDCVYLCAGAVRRPADGQVIVVSPEDHPEQRIADLCRELYPVSGRMITAPSSYVPATADSVKAEDQGFGIHTNNKTDTCWAEPGWILLDEDGDLLPDRLDAVFHFEEGPAYETCYAACMIAARLGMELTAIRYPLVSTQKPADTCNQIVLRSSKEGPQISISDGPEAKTVTVSGHGDELIKYVTGYFEKNFTGRHKKEIKERKYFDQDDLYVEEERAYDIGSEIAALQKLLESDVYPVIKPGDHVRLRGAVLQEKAVREQIINDAVKEISSRGAFADEVELVCAFKQGLSWLEEYFAPKAEKLGPVSRVIIRFDPHVRSGVTYHENGYDWKELDTRIDKPPRWLQDLFPVDALLSARLGIPEQDIIFESYPSDPEATYQAFAYDAAGNCILNESYAVHTEARDMLDILPEAGMSLPSTGYLEAYINEKEVLNTQIRTDLDRVWDVFQSDILPWLDEKAKAAGYDPDAMPFFHRIEIEAGVGGLERSIPGGTDHISSGEVLSDSIHQIGMQYFLMKGRKECGVALDAPGLILPIVHVRPGAPSLTARLVMARRDTGDQNRSMTAEELPQMKDLTIDQVDLMPDKLIGYEDYRRIMYDLARVRGLDVYPAGISYQGRTIYAVEPEREKNVMRSRTKSIQLRPTVLINGRHHSNEVSSTNAIFAFIRDLLTEPEYETLAEELNLIIVPMENVDGAALHYEMQKEHPEWQHQTCYTNSLGADLMPHYYEEDTIHTEAKVFRRITEEFLPDAFMDLHGVPHHDLPQHYGSISGYRGLWLPRALLCAFYFHIDEPAFASNKDLSNAWKYKVDNAYQDWEDFRDVSDRWEMRFRKYSWREIDNSFPCEKNGALLDYWVPSPYSARHPYPTIRYPWIYSVMFTAEAADETAHGEWLAKCREAHLRHTRAGIDVLRHTRLVMEEKSAVGDGTMEFKMIRHRPVVPVE